MQNSIAGGLICLTALRLQSPFSPRLETDPFHLYALGEHVQNSRKKFLPVRSYLMSRPGRHVLPVVRVPAGELQVNKANNLVISSDNIRRIRIAMVESRCWVLAVLPNHQPTDSLEFGSSNLSRISEGVINSLSHR